MAAVFHFCFQKGFYLKLYLLIALSVMLLLLAIVLGSQNSQLTQFNYLIAVSELRVATLTGIAMLIGALLASGFWMAYALALKMQLRANTKKFHRSLNNTDKS